jgi:hypothetical protein
LFVRFNTCGVVLHHSFEYIGYNGCTNKKGRHTMSMMELFEARLTKAERSVRTLARRVKELEGPKTEAVKTPAPKKAVKTAAAAASAEAKPKRKYVRKAVIEAPAPTAAAPTKRTYTRRTKVGA